MKASNGKKQQFLFLQGPHGPFFRQLARLLRDAGHNVWRVGFNRGDEVFWDDRAQFLPFTAPLSQWRQACAEIIQAHQITDLVLYGDTRPHHAQAIEVAQWAGLRVHVFEEGYLRPYWVTYERNGANGHSRLMDLGINQMHAFMGDSPAETRPAPARWGDMRQHLFYGAAYHFHVLFRNRRYAQVKPHRNLTVAQEFRLYLRRILFLPAHAAERALATSRVRLGGFPYHLVLLQLEHDASFRHHGPFASMAAFLEECVGAFARGAPAHHHLVFKAHPLEDGRFPMRRTIAKLTRQYGLAGRVHYVRGGKLASLLDHAGSAVTVNSTAGQQALWRGLPLKAFGRAVYSKPELVSPQPLEAFFAQPSPPDTEAYATYRRFLLRTSQITGGFYSARGRSRLLRSVSDLVLSANDPYDVDIPATQTAKRQLRIVD